MADGGAETTATRAASAATDGLGGSSAYPGRADADPGNAATAISATGSSAPSVTAAEVAPREQWFARIWPAIALGGGVGRVSVSVAAAIAADLFRPAAVAVAQALFLTSSNTSPPADLPSIAESPFVGQPGTANAPHPTFPGAAVTADGEKVLYLLALTLLLALLAFTIWREFRSALHPRRIRWHL